MRMEDAGKVAAVETSDSGEPAVKPLPVVRGHKVNGANVLTVGHTVLSERKPRQWLTCVPECSAFDSSGNTWQTTSRDA